MAADGSAKTFQVSFAPAITISTIAEDNIVSAAEHGAAVIIGCTTANVENTRMVTVGLNGHTYITSVSSNAWTLNVPAGDVGALADAGSPYTVTADVSNANNVAATQATRSLAVDTTAPTASVTPVSVNNSTSVTTARSTETGTIYLVKSTVATLTKAALDALVGGGTVRSATASSANTDTTIATTGLADGTYHVYAADAVGNVSLASTGAVVLDSTAPTGTVTANTLNGPAGGRASPSRSPTLTAAAAASTPAPSAPAT